MSPNLSTTRNAEGAKASIDEPLPFSPFAANLRSVIGYALMLIAFFGLISERLVDQAGLDFGITIVLRIGIGIAVIAIGLGGRRLTLTGRKQRAALAGRARHLDLRRPVLYLRSFDSDKKLENAHLVEGFIQLSTEEEQFATALKPIGPVVAIGDPREKLPTLGADRVYAGDTWRQNVLELLASARLVVVRLSATPGLQWELRQLVDHVEPTRLLLFLPLGCTYAALKAMAEPWLPKPLPAPSRKRTRIGTLFAVVRFHEDWSPELLPSRMAFTRMSLRRPLTPHLRFMLRPVFDQLGVTWTKPPWGLFPIILILMWISGALVFLSFALK
jgi:hypothetical protein